MSASNAFTRQPYACASIDFMNGTSAGEPLRIAASDIQGLCKLHAVAVPVEDVDDSHLTGQLEHGADLDALVPQPGGIRLRVLDVDSRHAAAQRGLALGERDAHLTLLELRPFVVPVDERLVEAEQPLVEVTPAIEVANEVPHARRSGHSASAGSSRNCFTVRRKSAPSAPSTAR